MLFFLIRVREEVKLKTLILLLLSFSLFSVNTYADESHGRIILKKWGMAYCLGKSNDKALSNDAGLARNGYFQLGEHDDDTAYVSVREYFDSALRADKLVGKETGKPNIVMMCLNAYESLEYDKVIRNQDKYLTTE